MREARRGSKIDGDKQQRRQNHHLTQHNQQHQQSNKKRHQAQQRHKRHKKNHGIPGIISTICPRSVLATATQKAKMSLLGM